MLGPNGPAILRHNGSIPELIVLGDEQCFEVPMINWYWAPESVSIMWDDRGFCNMLRIPPEQLITSASGRKQKLVRACDISLFTELVLSDNSRVTVTGLKLDKAQISMANVIFRNKGCAVTSYGVMLQT